MPETTQFLVQHGLLLLFVVVLVEQLGFPVPAPLILLAAGALSSEGKFNLLTGIVLTAIACLIADTVWFYLGRHRGHRVLGLLCRISLEPDSCVRRTQNVFTRYGLPGIAIAKFVPGMSTIAPPLAGMSGVHLARFLVVDGIGSILYGVTFLGLGYLFSSQIAQISAGISQVGRSALEFFALAAVLYIGYKFWQRQSLLKELRTARITVTELQQKLQAGENPIILDLRARAELERDPMIIPSAVHIIIDDLATRRAEFPHDRDIVVYCSCPNEATAARVAFLLQKHGFTRVRPLLGGIAAWREQNYPLESLVTTAPVNNGRAD